jgi:predicted outer membrane repeat protein
MPRMTAATPPNRLISHQFVDHGGLFFFNSIQFNSNLSGGGGGVSVTGSCTVPGEFRVPAKRTKSDELVWIIR